jgi:hypothetical protein
LFSPSLLMNALFYSVNWKFLLHSSASQCLQNCVSKPFSNNVKPIAKIILFNNLFIFLFCVYCGKLRNHELPFVWEIQFVHVNFLSLFFRKIFLNSWCSWNSVNILQKVFNEIWENSLGEFLKFLIFRKVFQNSWFSWNSFNIPEQSI